MTREEKTLLASDPGYSTAQRHPGLLYDLRGGNHRNTVVAASGAVSESVRQNALNHRFALRSNRQRLVFTNSAVYQIDPESSNNIPWTRTSLTLRIFLICPGRI